MSRRHCTDIEVNAIRNRLRRDGITDEAISSAMGLSRVQLNQMLNGHQPMRRVYLYAVIGYMVTLKANRKKV